MAIVILNWNNAPDTIACLASLQSADALASTIVVDNGSADGSAEVIEDSALPDIVIRTGANLGFAGGNNAGIRYALAQGFETIMVLNNDTVAAPDMIELLLKHLDEREAPTAVSPRINYHDAPDDLWFGGGTIDRGWPRHLDSAELKPATTPVRPSETLTGCCMLATAETWRQVGLFDERYFLIFEDSDWSMRAQRQGVLLLVADDAILKHRVSRSFQVGASSLLSSYYFARNGLRYELTWQRRYTLRFLHRWIARPVLRAVRHPGHAKAALFTLIGSISCLVGRTGPADRFTYALAARASGQRPLRKSRE